jgi:uncharacterized membrane protein YkvA (DUF1232 family)
MAGWIARLTLWARLLRRDGLTLWFALRDARTPRWVKAVALLIVAYALSPIDLIPDFIPVLGLLDEAILLPGLIWLVLRLLPAPVREACRGRAEAWLAERRAKPRMWLGAVGVVLVWAGALGLLAWGLWVWLQR